MFGPGSEQFPESQLRPEGTVSVTWPANTEEGMVDVHADLVYQAKDGERQHIQLLTPLDLFVPPEQQAKRYPLVVYVPGSAWHRQKVWMALDKARYFASRGIAFALVEYRPSEVAPFPAQIDDAEAALRFLLDRAEEFGLDPDRVALWGDSSGAHTAVSLALRVPEKIRCVADWFGPMDITEMSYDPSAQDHHAPDSPEGFLIGQRDVLEHPELAARTNPLNQISPDRTLPPFLIMHGSMDNIVHFHQSVLLYEKLRACGKEAVFYRLEGAGHGTGGFTSTEALGTVFKWIREKMG